MLGTLRSRCPSLSKKLSRGYLTERRQQKKYEWWSVDGEIHKAEEFDPKRVLEPSPNEQISNKKRRKDRHRHLVQTRLKLRSEGQESYWAAYIRRYQIMRDEWEKLVWDPTPVTQPKIRNPSLVQQDAERYVWRDPRRDSYDYQDRRDSRMARPSSASNFDSKTVSRAQSMDRYPYGGQRSTGTTTSKFGTPYQSLVDKRGSYKPYADGQSEEGFRGVDQPYGRRVGHQNADKNRAGGIHPANRMFRDDEKDRNDKYEHRWSKDNQDAKEHNRKFNSWSEDEEDSEDDEDSEEDDENKPGSVKRAKTIFRNEEKDMDDRYKHKTERWSEEDYDDSEDQFAEEDDDDEVER